MNEKIYNKLKKVRNAESLTLKPCDKLKDKIRLQDGSVIPFKLRNYQIQMVYHTLMMKRFIIGDDTGLGKSLEGITTLCYLWEKEPDLKPIIVTKTSAMRQWGQEIDKFTNDVGWTLVEGGPEDRAKIYESYFEDFDEEYPSVLVVNYHRLRRDFRHFMANAEGHRYVMVYDECFDYYTPITLADGSTEIIGKIVNQKMDVEVLSYNFDTGKVEPKKITNWYRNTKKTEDGNTLLKINFGYGNTGFGNSVRCTRSHNFYTPEGEKVQAKDLQEGDRILRVVHKEEEFYSTVSYVSSVEECAPKHKANKYVYDIEVEDNHNYFAGGALVSNCTAFKNTASQTHKVCKNIADEAERVYGLTATLIKNNLEEGYGIFKVIHPEVFRTKKGFHRDYCVTRKQRIPGKRRRYVRVIVGHSQNHIQKFKEKIDPYYLGRAKHDVADELPVLTTKEVYVPCEYSQWQYYQEALSGLLTINIGEEDEEEKETTKLTQLIYCQEIVDSPALIGNDIKSGKEEFFLEMLSDELENEKVIVFTRFRSMVDKLQGRLEDEGYSLGIAETSKGEWDPVADKDKVEKGFVRITGDEDSSMRDAGRRAFTETENTNLIFLTMAGAEAINLQQARIMVFYDMPWSAGDYLQLVGRMIRIGSPHNNVYAIHLIGEGPDKEDTIDHHVLGTLQKKMKWIESALGERLVKNKGDEDIEEEFIEIGGNTNDIFERVQQSARNLVG